MTYISVNVDVDVDIDDIFYEIDDDDLIKEIEKIATATLPRTPKIEPRKFCITLILRTSATFPAKYCFNDISCGRSLFRERKMLSILFKGSSIS